MLLALLFLAAIALGWTALCGALIVWASRRIRALDAIKPQGRMFWPVVPMHYAVALAWWWPAVPMGIWMVRQPDLARQGRITFYWAALPAVAYLLTMLLVLVSR